MTFPGKMLSDEGVKVVLGEMLNDHDAEVGISWDTISILVREHMDFLVDDPSDRGEEYS